MRHETKRHETTGRIDLKAPSNWRELTVDQLRIVAEVLRLHFTKEEMLVVLLCRLTGIRMQGGASGNGPEVFVTADGQSFTMHDYELADFASRFEWVFADEPCDIANPTKADGHMRGVKFGDWFRADALFHDLAKGRNEDDCNLKDMRQALALLGHKDVSFPNDAVEFDMVLLWWHGVGNMLRVLYPYVFARSGEPSKGYSPFKNLQNIHLMLNGGRPQDNEAIDRCDLHDVLSALNHKIEEAEMLKKQLEKTKSGR